MHYFPNTFLCKPDLFPGTTAMDIWISIQLLHLGWQLWKLCATKCETCGHFGSTHLVLKNWFTVFEEEKNFIWDIKL